MFKPITNYVTFKIYNKTTKFRKYGPRPDLSNSKKEDSNLNKSVIEKLLNNRA